MRKWQSEGPERQRRRSDNFWRGRGREEDDASSAEDLPLRAPSPDGEDDASALDLGD